MSQLTHYNSNFKKRKFPITLVCENVTNAPNIGSLFRTADAFGVESVVLCGTSISLGKRMTKTSRSTENYIPYKIEENIKAVIQDFKTKDYFIVALEITENSQDLTDFKLNTTQAIVLILGDENHGISQEILDLTDAILHLNMYGNNSSMNVVQATSITLYELTKQLNR